MGEDDAVRLPLGEYGQDRAALFFERDSIDAYEDVFPRHRGDLAAPERRLLRAVLEDALKCLEKCARARDRRGRKLFEETAGWMLAEDEDSIFSFRSVCEALGLDPSYIRKHALGRTANKSEAGPRTEHSSKARHRSAAIARGKRPLRRSAVERGL